MQSISNKREDEIENTGDAGSTQLCFTQSSQENIIGDEINLRYKHGQADR